MTEPEDLNPYTSPHVEGGGQPATKPYRPVIRLFVLPFFLAHLVYWPTFFVSLQITRGDGYGITAMFHATAAIAVAGAIYGAWTGMWLRSGPLGYVHTFHPVLYALGQGIWFVVSVFAACAVFAGASTF